jgi:hypothetical protein
MTGLIAPFSRGECDRRRNYISENGLNTNEYGRMSWQNAPTLVLNESMRWPGTIHYEENLSGGIAVDGSLPTSDVTNVEWGTRLHVHTIIKCYEKIIHNMLNGENNLIKECVYLDTQNKWRIKSPHYNSEEILTQLIESESIPEDSNLCSDELGFGLDNDWVNCTAFVNSGPVGCLTDEEISRYGGSFISTDGCYSLHCDHSYYGFTCDEWETT